MDDIVSRVKGSLHGNVTPSGIVDLTIEIMKVLATFHDLPGREKKAVLLRVLKDLINETTDNHNNEAVRITGDILEFVVPTLVDRLVSVENGQLAINKNVTGCTGKCLPF